MFGKRKAPIPARGGAAWGLNEKWQMRDKEIAAHPPKEEKEMLLVACAAFA